MNSRATQRCNTAPYLSSCSLVAANSQINVLIGQKMQLTGCDYGNDMRGTKRSDLNGPTVQCSFPVL